MRRRLHLFALLAALLLPLWASAQELTVAEGTSTSNQIPVRGFYIDWYQHCQLIYPSDMLEEMTGSDISQLTWYIAIESSSTWNAEAVISLGEVESSTFSSGFLSPELTEVWTGTVTGRGTTWDVEFSEPFQYGGGNLLVDILITTPSSTGYDYAYFAGINSSNASCYGNSSTSYSSISGSSQNFLPKCTFTYSASGASICYKPNNLQLSGITADEATFSWTARGEESQWAVYLNGEVVEVVTDTFATFSSLAPSTAYTASVRAICGDGDTSGYSTTSFRTQCATITTLPWNENFNSLVGSSSASDASSIVSNLYCWTVTEAYSYYSYITTYHNQDEATNGNSIRIYGGNDYKTFMALPPFEEDIENLMLTFYTYADNSYITMAVGYMTNPSDGSTFVGVDTIIVGTRDVWEYQEVTFPEGATGNMAIHVMGSGTNNFYVDNFTVQVRPSCTRPAALYVSDVTEATATLHITDPNALNHYVLLGYGDDPIELTTNEYDLEDLNPATLYTLNVASLCADGDTTHFRTLNFRTACSIITQLPYSEDFTGYATGSSEEDPLPCWVLNRNSGYPCVSSGRTGNGLYFYNYGSATTAAMPELEEQPANLLLSFWASMSNTYVQLEVGIMTDPEDMSTFSPVSTFSPTSTYTYEQYEVTFPGITEGRIAFRLSGQSYTTFTIDDIVLSPLPECMRPESINISNLAATSATLTIMDATESGNYQLWFENSTDTIDIEGYTYELEDLNANTTYTVFVRSICGDGSITNATRATFTTPCTSISTLPWTEDFESYSSSNSSPLDISCWTIHSYYTSSYYSSIYYPYIYSYGGHSSNNSLYFYASSTLNSPEMVVLPPFEEPLNNLMLSLWMRSSALGSIDVGVVSNPDDVNSFTLVRTITPYTSDVYGDYEFTFADFTSGFIALRYNSTTAVYIDDITVSLAPDCRRPEAVSVSNITENAATFHINDPSQSGLYRLYIEYNGAVTDSVDISDTIYTYESLQASSLYTAHVATLCDQEPTSTIPIQFSTSCAPISHDALPYIEDFESYTAADYYTETEVLCWTISNHYFSTFLYPYIMSANNTTPDGTNCMFISGSGETSPFLVLPAFEDNLSALMLNCTLKLNGAGSMVVVGYCTDPADVSTFVPTDTAAAPMLTTGVANEFEFTFPAEATGYIALRPIVNNTGIFLDDIMVSANSGCIRPSNVAISNLTSTSAEVVITDANEVGAYRITYTTGSTTETVDITGSTYTLENLNPATTYSLQVSTICDEGAISNPTAITFSTLCATVNIPWSEDFNNVSNTSDLNCWDMYNGLMDQLLDGSATMEETTGFWSIKSTGGNESKHVAMNVYYDNRRTHLITPTLAIDVDAELTFTISANAYNSSNAYTNFDADDRAAVLITTDGGTTWSRLVSWGTNDEDTCAFTAIEASGTTYTLSLTDFIGQEVRFSFYGESTASGSDWDLGFDDISVSYAGDTPQPTRYSVSATSANTAMGSASCTPSGNVIEGTTVTATATPNQGYQFVNWTDANGTVVSTANPYTFTVSANVSLTANFEATQGIDDVASASVSLAPNPATSTVSVGFEGKAVVSVLDMSGREVMRTEATSNATLDVSSIARGTYFVRVGNEHYTAVRKLVVK